MKLKTTISALLAAMLLLTSCGTAPAAASSQAPTSSQLAEQQSSLMDVALNADKLIIGTASQIEQASRADYYFDVLTGTLSQLAPVRLDDKGNYQPLLTDFATEDAKVWRLTVRDKMTWQDGVPVTAKDIAFTLNYLDKQEEGKYLGKYQSVTVVDDRTLELTLKTPNINALSDLTTLRIIPEHIFRDIPTLADATVEQSTLGCGPYSFVAYDKAAGTIEFAANADYVSDRQFFKTVIFKMYGNADTMLLALQKGDIDMVYSYAGGIDPAAAESLAGSERPITVTAIKDTSNPAVLVFNNSAEPWNNVELRRAVYHALDYDKFRELFGSQYSTPSNAGFAPAGSVSYIDTAVNTRNLDEARAALVRAGYTEGKALPTLELTIRNDKPVYQRYAELVRANLADIGITVELKPLDVPQFRTVTEQEHTNKAMISRFTAFGMGMGAGMGSSYLDARLTSNGQGQVADPVFGKIVDSMKSAATAEQYATAAADCQRFYADQLPAIALYWDSYIQAHDATLEGFVVDGTFGLLNTETWFSLHRK